MTRKIRKPSETIVLVCGASGGLGPVLAKALAARGYQVYGTSRNGVGGAAEARMVAMDITPPASIEQALGQIKAEAGRIDVVVNCVNEMVLGTLEELAEDEVRRVYDVNVLGFYQLAHALTPIQRAQGGGTIIAMSSLGGIVAVPHLGAYTSAKHALEAFAEALYHEAKPDNIDVVIMQPVAMRMTREATGDHLKVAAAAEPASITRKIVRIMHKESTEQSGLTPQAVAEKICSVIASRRRKLRYPMDRAKTLGVVKRLAPQWVIDRLIRGLVNQEA